MDRGIAAKAKMVDRPLIAPQVLRQEIWGLGLWLRRNRPCLGRAHIYGGTAMQFSTEKKNPKRSKSKWRYVPNLGLGDVMVLHRPIEDQQDFTQLE